MSTWMIIIFWWTLLFATIIIFTTGTTIITLTTSSAMALSSVVPSSITTSATTSETTKKLVNRMIALAQKQMKKSSNKTKSKQMQKYLKTNMPMYGLQRPERSIVETKIYEYIEAKGKFDNNNNIVTTGPQRRRRGEKTQIMLPTEFYRYSIQQFWDLPMREEKYLAIDIAMKYKTSITIECLDVYESFLRSDYMWWDLCDPIATNLIGHITRTDFDNIRCTLQRWINDENMWIRRTAILAQLKSKSNTNQHMLFGFCRLRMHEKEFFIKKAIGWLLREYSKTNPEAVIEFLEEEKANLSALSYKEGSKHLIKQGRM